MVKGKQQLVTLGLLMTAILFQGCATNLRKPAQAPQPPTVKFSKFRLIRLNHVTISKEFGQNAANQKARKKIDEVLFAEMRKVFAKKIQDATGAKDRWFSKAVIVEPHIEEIKFIGGGVRFMLGAMAGSSAVLMKVTYKDAKGTVIAEPEFYRSASAFAGGMYGSADNAMLAEIAKDIVNYTAANQ